MYTATPTRMATAPMMMDAMPMIRGIRCMAVSLVGCTDGGGRPTLDRGEETVRRPRDDGPRRQVRRRSRHNGADVGTPACPAAARLPRGGTRCRRHRLLADVSLVGRIVADPGRRTER